MRTALSPLARPFAVFAATAIAVTLAVVAGAGWASFALSIAAVASGVTLAWRLSGRSVPSEDEASETLRRLADEGRRLAIYDRVTGLYAYWYLQMRCQEEFSRAARYNKPVTVLNFWADTRDAIEILTAELARTLRATDLAAYLGNGHFVVLLPETGVEGANVVLDRVQASAAGDTQGVIVQYPDDGENLNQLLTMARVMAQARTARPRKRSEKVA